MNSSISSSEPRSWRRFLAAFAVATALPAFLVYLFVVLVDPWGMLPVHLPIARAPISTNARFSFPALAVSPTFDAAVIGSSTSRLLEPAELDPIFGAHFANLAMNAATPWEQTRLLGLFARHHPDARAVIVGLDQAWCLAGPDAPHLTGRAFPDWMYGGSPWRGYLRMFNLYAVQEAANQLAYATGFKKKHYGLDGYTNFLPPDSAYDRRRVDAIVASWGAVSTAPPTSPILLPYVDALSGLLGSLPRGARKVLLFPPPTIAVMGVPGTAIAASWAACKDRAKAVARAVPNTIVVDFAFPNAITRDTNNFWDPLHYRIGIARRITAAIARALNGSPDGDDRVFRGAP